MRLHKNNTEILQHVIYCFVFYRGNSSRYTLEQGCRLSLVTEDHLRYSYFRLVHFPQCFHFFFFLNLFHPLLLHNQQQEIRGFPHHVFNSMRVWLWCHLLFSVNFPPTLNVSCYRAQRSSVVYFPMMLSAMWLTPLRGEGNQPFHLQRRGNVEVLADSIFSSVVLTASQQSLTHSLTLFFFKLMWAIFLIVLQCIKMLFEIRVCVRTHMQEHMEEKCWTVILGFPKINDTTEAE